MFILIHLIIDTRIIKFADSTYDTPAHIERMEAQGQTGDTILVEGAKTGSAKVRVQPRDAVYKVCKIVICITSLDLLGGYS